MTAAALPGDALAADRAEVYRARYLIAFAVTLASVLELVDTSIVNVALPHMMGNLGATLEEIAWVSTGYIVANVIVLPLTAWFATQFGRRNYYVGSIVLFTVASFFCGNASSLEGLVFWRIIQGLGGGALIATAQAIMFDVFPIHERPIAMAIFGIGVMVGPAMGPTLGGWITDNFNWPWIFFINLPLGALAALLCWRLVPEPSQRMARGSTVDWPGIAFLVIGIGALQMVLEGGEAHDWFESREIQLEAAAAALGIICFIWRELTTDHPIVDLRILKNRQLAAGVLFGSALGVALYASVFALPVFLQRSLGYSAETTGWVILPGAIASAVTMAVMGRVIPRIDVRTSIVIGIGLYFWSMVLHAQLTAASGPQDTFWPLVLRGIGLGMIFPPLTQAAVADLSPAQYGQGTALFSLSRQLGGSFGIAIVANLIRRFTENGYDALRSHVGASDPATAERLLGAARRFQALGDAPELARQKATMVIDYAVRQQAAVLAFEKIFLIMGISFVAAMPLLFLFRTGRVAGRAKPAH
ncbi:MAG: DHA2 family efflux MFS transporter permease subunit [Gemmatimonadales bacterium]